LRKRDLSALKIETANDAADVPSAPDDGKLTKVPAEDPIELEL
jgi:hypothetical protein